MKKIIAKAGLCALAATFLLSGTVMHRAQAAREITGTSAAGINWRKKDKNEQKDDNKEASPAETPGAPKEAPSKNSESSFILK